MMQPVADETTVHGVKDTYYANWLGRVFFGVVFIFCSVMMVLQLQGLFEGYMEQSTGTRTGVLADKDMVEVPSFYYCHDAPFPNIGALRDLLNATRHEFMHEKLRDCVYSRVYGGSPNPSVCTPYLKYWKQATILRELLTGIVLPPERGRPRVSAFRKLRPDFDKKVASSLRYYASLKSVLYAEMAKLRGSSLQQVLKDQMTADPKASDSLLNEHLSNEIHGVLVNDFETLRVTQREGFSDADVYYNYEPDEGFYVDYDTAYDDNIDDKIGDFTMHAIDDGIAYEYQNMFGDSEIVKDEDLHSVYASIANSRVRAYPTISLDGVCWEVKPQSQLSKPRDAIGRTDQHLVTHLGGFGPQLREIVYPRHDQIPYGQNIKPNHNHDDGFKQPIVDAMKYMEMNIGVYTSYVSIAGQGGSHLSLGLKIPIDANSPHVLIKYWTKKRAVKNKRSNPCMPWTTLDQAHCNQERMRKNENGLCEQYLPPSRNFPEKNVTDDICIHNHKGFLADAAMSDSLLKRYFEDYQKQHDSYPNVWENANDEEDFVENLVDGFADLDFLKLDRSPRWKLISNLTESSPECPRPCTWTSYHFDVSYPVPSESNARKCAAALAYFFVPTVADNARNDGAMPPGKMNNATLEAYTYAYYTLWGSRNPSWKKFPCSVVEFQRAEIHGKVSEEFFLYGLPDLASNVGGTLGLWIGASVISFIQFFYLTCLEKMFRKASTNPQEADGAQES